uniref:Anaphylatoxin-like domain-containing protein n=1 Tax=Sinocyclocheilus rhinocerous TaxID=307959 RepID=A0A673L552_9TELE
MEVKLLFLTVVLLSSPLLTLCAPLFVLSAPNLLRVGSSENLFVEAQDYSGGNMNVKIIVKNHPKKDLEILSKFVTLTAANNFQILTDIKIPSDRDYFSADPLEKQYVYLQAQFPSITLEQVVMLSFQSGYIFVQTDKPIYTPASTVHYRIFSLTPNMKPLDGSGITMEIMVNTLQCVRGLCFSPGIWKVVTLFSNTPQKNFTADFEVKEYVLPTFEVKLKPSKSFFYVGDESLTVGIEAKYLFGQKVDGNAFVVFGVMEDEKKTSIPTSLQKVQIVKGEGTAELTSQMITETFPNINQLVGRSIYVSVSLLTESGSEMVEAERRGIQIVTSPYTIHFKKTPHFFKPGMPFSVSVYITNPDQTPAENVDVEVNSGEVRGQTKANGIAKVTVNTLGVSSTLEITAKTKDPQIKDEKQQAVKKMTAQAYIPRSRSNNYLHIGIDAAELQIGDPMTVYLNTGKSPGFKDQDYTYMVKMMIVKADRFKRKGQSLVALSLPVTKDMVPSFRFVAYYHVGSSEVVSDSVWVDVKDTCMGKVGRFFLFFLFLSANDISILSFTVCQFIQMNCPLVPERPVPAKRKRRSESLLQITSTLAGQYSGELKQCCFDGMRNNKLGYTCERRATYIVDGAECVKAFLDCCNKMKTSKNLKTEEEELILARNDDDMYYTDSEEIVSRTQFPESWFWDEFELFSFSCCIQVRVEFMETEDVCSSASKKGKYRTTVSVEKGSSIAVSYVIIPMTLVNHMIEVKAAAYDFSDGVRKPLKVVSEGVLTALHRENVELNPAKNGEIYSCVPSLIPPAEEIAQTVEQAINGSFMGRLIVQPSGCGEQNMYRMTLPLIATHYLDSTNQWDTVGMERRSDAVNHISTGYQGQLDYRKTDGSYAVHIKMPSSTWLTAYVAKVFAMANNLVSIEGNVICSALKWLVLHKQLPDGSFKEESAVISRGMVGGVEGNDADASLTAFVVIAMQEGREICAESVASLHESIRKAVVFLEGRLPQLTNPYAVAMTSYAMANANKFNKGILMRHSTQGKAGRSWTVPGQHHHSLEATAYAVLALVKDKDFHKAGEAVHWLNRQQTHYGAYGTTQATIMVFQAVAEYRTQVKDRQTFNLDVELSVAGRSKPVKWAIKRNNAHLTRSDRVRSNTIKSFKMVLVLTLYYARPVEKKSDCTFFDLTVKMEKDNEGKIELLPFLWHFPYMTILIMSCIEVFVFLFSCSQLSSGKERYIQKYEKNKVLSERGSLILYLNKVSHRETERIVFRMHQMLNVGQLQPAAVTIYEYYSPDAHCTKFYHPERTDGAIYRLCKGDLCQCAEENCTFQRKNNTREEERLNKACEGGMDYGKGTDDNVEGKVRQFLARPSCREYLGLVEGKSYLIMGRSVDLPKLGGSLQYIFGEHTWIEYWPTRAESQTPEHRERYIGISDLQSSLSNYGCAT